MFRTTTRSAIVTLALLFGTPDIASACSVVVTDHSARARRAEARRAVEQATAIIDGEVVRPFVPGVQNALVRAYRVFRGPEVDTFEIGERNSCDIALMNEGERSRMLLMGGPDVYYLQLDYSNARYEDRLLGSDRRADWPYRKGASGTPER